MLSNAQIKQIRSLHQNKYRRKLNRFLSEGTVNVLEFIHGPLPVIAIYATESWIAKYSEENKDLPIQPISAREMEKISALKNPSEVLAVIEKPEYSLPDLSSTENFVLALDNIRDPGNLGTIIRTADWFGIPDVVCSHETVDAFNPKVVQATMGSLARIRVHYTSLTQWLSSKPSDFPLWAAVLDGDDIRQSQPPPKGILLIGSEAHGISPSLSPFFDKKIKIPSAPNRKTESLNAAVATAILCYALRLPFLK